MNWIIKQKIITIMAVLFMLMLSGCGHAGEVDTVLEKAKKEQKAVMLELGSVGCIPCEQMKPVMQQLRDNYKGKLEVLFVDVRVNKEVARKYNVFGIPTQVFLDKNGKEFSRHIGFYPYEEIQDVLKKIGL
jgi:thioredoxin 1